MVKITICTRQGTVVEQLVIQPEAMSSRVRRDDIWLDIKDEIDRAEKMDQAESGVNDAS